VVVMRTSRAPDRRARFRCPAPARKCHRDGRLDNSPRMPTLTGPGARTPPPLMDREACGSFAGSFTILTAGGGQASFVRKITSATRVALPGRDIKFTLGARRSRNHPKSCSSRPNGSPLTTGTAPPSRAAPAEARCVPQVPHRNPDTVALEKRTPHAVTADAILKLQPGDIHRATAPGPDHPLTTSGGNGEDDVEVVDLCQRRRYRDCAQKSLSGAPR
jgi:hypothetical protein